MWNRWEKLYTRKVAKPLNNSSQKLHIVFNIKLANLSLSAPCYVHPRKRTIVYAGKHDPTCRICSLPSSSADWTCENIAPWATNQGPCMELARVWPTIQTLLRPISCNLGRTDLCRHLSLMQDMVKCSTQLIRRSCQWRCACHHLSLMQCSGWHGQAFDAADTLESAMAMCLPPFVAHSTCLVKFYAWSISKRQEIMMRGVNVWWKIHRLGTNPVARRSSLGLCQLSDAIFDCFLVGRLTYRRCIHMAVINKVTTLITNLSSKLNYLKSHDSRDVVGRSARAWCRLLGEDCHILSSFFLFIFS